MKITTDLNLSNAKVTLCYDSAYKKYIGLQLEDSGTGYADASFFTLKELDTLINVLTLAKNYFTEEMNNED